MSVSYADLTVSLIHNMYEVIAKYENTSCN